MHTILYELLACNSWSCNETCLNDKVPGLVSHLRSYLSCEPSLAVHCCGGHDLTDWAPRLPAHTLAAV